MDWWQILLLVIYVVGYVGFTVVSLYLDLSGREGLGEGVIILMVWPLLLAIIIVILIFLEVWKLGKKLNGKEATDE